MLFILIGMLAAFTVSIVHLWIRVLQAEAENDRLNRADYLTKMACDLAAQTGNSPAETLKLLRQARKP